MCSIIKLNGKVKNIVEEVVPELYKLLCIKGGDEFNIIIKHEHGIQYLNNSISIISDLINILNTYNINNYIDILAFSRLTPEMEIECGNNLPQPYYNYSSKNNTIVAVHGTIPSAEKIAEKYGFKINVDTEIFYHLPFNEAIHETELAGGKICAIGLDNKSHEYHNGLGLFYYETIRHVEITTNLNIELFLKETDMDLRFIKTKVVDAGNLELEEPVRIISLFSGGLDITCSTQKVIEQYLNNTKSIDLWYFDWGTRAASQEIHAGREFAKHLNFTLIPNDGDHLCDCIEHMVIPVESMFRNILSAATLTSTRLLDNDATGAGSYEAESAISYVPYRNTFLLTLAAARAEQLYPGETCIFVIGANLSEGMIYLDNSEPFITAMNSLIKLGGQKSMYFKVQAPYVNFTKTKMVKDALSRGYDLTSYSCYFPDADGKVCGVCGSCLLRENALARGI